jgi:hypothetical protein
MDDEAKKVGAGCSAGRSVALESTGCQRTVPEHGPLDQYLMERNAEIALARSAAPQSISQDAEIMVLGQHGYETAVKGKNGFVCTEAVGSIHLARNDEERNLALRRTADDTTEAERTVWGLGEKLVRTFRHCKRTVQFFVPYLRSS